MFCSCEKICKESLSLRKNNVKSAKLILNYGFPDFEHFSNNFMLELSIKKWDTVFEFKQWRYWWCQFEGIHNKVLVPFHFLKLSHFFFMFSKQKREYCIWLINLPSFEKDVLLPTRNETKRSYFGFSRP